MSNTNLAKPGLTIPKSPDRRKDQDTKECENTSDNVADISHALTSATEER